jgi:hypothetical protein
VDAVAQAAWNFPSPNGAPHDLNRGQRLTSAKNERFTGYLHLDAHNKLRNT